MKPAFVCVCVCLCAAGVAVSDSSGSFLSGSDHREGERRQRSDRAAARV